MNEKSVIDLLYDAFEAVKEAKDRMEDDDGEPKAGNKRKWKKLDNICGALENIMEELKA